LTFGFRRTAFLALARFLFFFLVGMGGVYHCFPVLAAIDGGKFDAAAKEFEETLKLTAQSLDLQPAARTMLLLAQMDE